MDLGIRGKRALVCASSKGLGRGCAEALAQAGVDLVICARGADALQETAQALEAAHGVSVTPVACDITTEAGRAQVLAAAGQVDILVTNAGGPPPGLWSDWSRADFLAAIDANMLTPIALMQALLPGMMDRGWGRVVNITSQSVKAPIAQLGLSNTARAGLTGFVAGTARQVAHRASSSTTCCPASTRPTAPLRWTVLWSRPRGSPWIRPSTGAPPRSPCGATARRPNLARCARFCVPPMRALSSGRTSCWMVAR